MAGRPNGTGTVYKRTDGRYEASLFVPTTSGARRRVSAYARTSTEAHAKLATLTDKARRGETVADQSMTLSRFLDYWLTEVVPIKARPRTIELYELTVRRDIRPLLGPIKLTKLSVSDVQRAINYKLDNGATPRTVHKMRTILSSALSRAMREELVTRNVARLVDLPSYERKEITPWTADDATRFLTEAKGHDWELGYQLLIFYGMRRGEVIGLRWSDIDFAAGFFRINQQIQRVDGKLRPGPVKTSAGRRRLPLLPAIREGLFALAAKQGFALPDDLDTSAFGERLVLASKTGAPVEPGNFARAFYLLIEKAGLRRITVHQTRHTAATLLKRLGVPPRDAQLILGHANVTTTQQIYQHGDIDAQRTALEAVQNALVPSAKVSTGLAEVALPSRRQQTVENQTAEAAVATIENRRLPEVVTAEFLGGSGGTRTHDILLKSFAEPLLVDLPTSVLTAQQRRTRRQIVGCVAVNSAVNSVAPSVPSTTRPATLIAARRALGHALTDQLRRRSFPFNLAPTAKETT